MIIDADTHVIETERTWDYLDASQQKFRPTLMSAAGDAQNVAKQEYWVVDGKIRGFRFPTLTEKQLADLSSLSGRNVETPQEAREGADIQLRLKHMDALGVDIQVLHNTLFIEQVTDRPDIDVALCGSWNRWMADVWKQGQGRLFWSCVPPLLSMRDAIDQVRFASENGAVAICMRPLEGNRLFLDEYFYPIYEEAERLNLAVAIHIANGNPYVCDAFRFNHFSASAFSMFRVPTVTACHSLIMSELPRTFKQLRWGFIESAAQWLPWVLNEAARRYEGQGETLPRDILSRERIYLTCQTDDDLPYILQRCGAEDNMMIGTDYGHTDPSSELDAISIFKEMDGVTSEQKQKILDENPRRFYAIT